MYEKIFSRGHINGVELKNRVIMGLWMNLLGTTVEMFRPDVWNIFLPEQREERRHL